MKLGNIISPLNDLRYAFFTAIAPTLRTLLKSPSILLHPKQLSRLFFSHVWTLFADHIDAGGRDSKLGLIKDVRGIILDIGAGNTRNFEYVLIF